MQDQKQFNIEEEASKAMMASYRQENGRLLDTVAQQSGMLRIAEIQLSQLQDEIRRLQEKLEKYETPAKATSSPTKAADKKA